MKQIRVCIWKASFGAKLKVGVSGAPALTCFPFSLSWRGSGFWARTLMPGAGEGWCWHSVGGMVDSCLGKCSQGYPTPPSPSPIPWGLPRAEVSLATQDLPEKLSFRWPSGPSPEALPFFTASADTSPAYLGSSLCLAPGRQALALTYFFQSLGWVMNGPKPASSLSGRGHLPCTRLHGTSSLCQRHCIISSCF